MKKLLLMIAALGIMLGASGQSKLSFSTQAFLDRMNGVIQPTAPLTGMKVPKQVKARSLNGKEVIDCFVRLNGRSVADIEAVGGKVQARFGDNLVTATIPIDQLENLADRNGIQSVAVAQLMKVNSDYARQKTYVDQVLNGLSNNLPAAYTGSGIVVGVVDTGMEFNHLAFKEGGTANGASRVKLVYMPSSTTANGGSAPVIDGNTLPGYQYTTATQIANLTTDNTSESHGTHTTGCAGGSHVNTYSGSSTYSGMAPGCDLVMCGCGSSLSDTNIANSCLVIAEYAKSVGKPCVINLSLGSNTGPHDGSAEICQALDAIAEEYGAVILISAGNEGDEYIYSGGTSTGTSTPAAATILAPLSSFAENYGSTYHLYQAGIDAWSSTSDDFQVQFVIIDSSGNVKWTSNKYSGNATLSGSTTGSNNEKLSKYFGSSSQIKVYGGRDTNNRYHIQFQTTLYTGSTTGYKFGVLYFANNGVRVDAFTYGNYNELASASSSAYNFVCNPGEYSLNDMATGFKTICIGAYASRISSIPYYYGQYNGSMGNGDYAEDDIASFSSYGTDFNGVNHPFISSPGHTVVSSVNRHDEDNDPTESALRVRLSGSGSSAVYDYWQYMSGTSMAAPVAAGIVALWLECDPTLDVDGVKDVMLKSCINDSHMPAANVRWGCGKINALEGIKYILAKNRKVYILGNVAGDWNPMLGQEMETEDGIIHTATLDAVDSGDGACYFSFTTKLATQSGNNGWNEIASSRFGAANSSGNYWITQFDTPISLAANGESFRIPKGKYTLTVDYDNMTLTVHNVGVPLDEAMAQGNGDYTISNDLKVVDYAEYANYLSATDGNGTWITITAADEIFNTIYRYGTLKGGTITGTISGSELNPVLTLTATPQESSQIINVNITEIDLTEHFSPVIDELCYVSGYYKASEGTLRAYSGKFGPQGQSLLLDTSWGEQRSNVLQDGKFYRNVQVVINLISAWSGAPAKKVSQNDPNSYFQNYRAYAMRIPAPEVSTAIDDIISAGEDQPVNVYNLQGIMLKKAVKAKDATVGLTPGFYIIGGNKVLVK